MCISVVADSFEIWGSGIWDLGILVQKLVFLALLHSMLPSVLRWNEIKGIVLIWMMMIFRLEMQILYHKEYPTTQQ